MDWEKNFYDVLNSIHDEDNSKDHQQCLILATEIKLPINNNNPQKTLKNNFGYYVKIHGCNIYLGE